MAKSAIPGIVNVNITNKPEVIAAAERIAYLKTLEAAGAAAEVERKALEAEVIRPALGESPKGIVRGIAAITQHKGSSLIVDTATLKLKHPAIWAEIASHRPYTYFKYNVAPATPAE